MASIKISREHAPIFGVAAALFFVIGVIAGHFVPWPSGAHHSNFSAATESTNGRRFAFQKVRSAGAKRAEEAPVKGFQYTRLDLDTSGDLPKACFVFSQKLDASAKTNYGDYVRLTGDKKPAVQVNGQTLCIAGLDFDTDYRATLRQGLPSAAGERLARAETVTIAFGDKPAYVGFSGDGVILPRFEADGVGIETVNVDKIKVTVRRVSDRALARKEIVKGSSVSAEDYYYVDDSESGEDDGVVVYEGEIATKAARNQTKTTVFPLGAALKTLKPGAYYVNLADASPGSEEYRAARAWRWVLFTDIALTTYSSDVGLDVVARSLATAKPLPGLKLVLIARNNDELAVAATDRDGRAHFDEAQIAGDGPLTPRMVMAYGAQDDFAAIDLQRASLDLSDRNIGGRAAPAKLDGYVYFDRGIYRPGEIVRVSGLLRDDAGRAVNGRPLTVVISRPNGAEALKRRIDKTEIGGFSFDYELPAAASRGVWTVAVTADGVTRSVASQSFSVEDFVPQRLDVKLAVDEQTPMRAGDDRRIGVASRFLYGAPAAGLSVEAEARLGLDPNPFPDYRGYRYGPANTTFEERIIDIPGATLDEKGEGEVRLALADLRPGVGAPLRADLRVGVVEPGGRVVRESARVPVRADSRYVGLKLESEGSGFGEKEPAVIDAIVVDANGKSIATDLDWRLVEEDYWFDWYRESGEWRWRRSYKDILVTEGHAAHAPGKPARISQTLDPGSYRLIATDPKSGAKTEQRFYVGWRSYAEGADTPDQAAVSPPAKPAAPGSTVKLTIDPPYAGEATIVIATDRVQRIQRLTLEKKPTEITIATDPSWGAGFYVMTSIVTPRDPGARPVPRRAMGVAYVPFDMSSRTLQVSLDAPKLLRPRQKISLPVKIAGAKGGEAVRVTLAAVDEGILRLTKFVSPDPAAYYFGKKALDVAVRDDYSRILNANLGAAAKFGGDEIGGEGLTVVPTKTVALFSGLVHVGAGGVANISVEIPDFNGELRLMAVAWSADRLGSASQPLTVRDPVPAELSLPRFLAPGDQAQATLLVDNVDGAAGSYQVALRGGGAVATRADENLTLAKSQKRTSLFPVTSREAGIGGLTLSVHGPGGFAVARSYPIEVRPAYYPSTAATTEALAPGATFSLDESILAPFVKGTTAVSVSFSRLQGIDPGPLLDSLDRYPYGCSEQLVSRALPLLFVDILGGEAGRGPDRAVRPRVQKAINQLLEREGLDGAFGLWREDDGWASPWLGAYVVDFLTRAKAEGYGVPDEALDRALKALQQIGKIDRYVSAHYDMDVYDGPGATDTRQALRRRAAAYALYVLARAGKADLSDLRYFHDALLDKTFNPLAKAQIGAALAIMGDRARAKDSFDKAFAAIGANETAGALRYYDYYQTPLRDAAGIVALAAEAGRGPDADRFVGRLAAMMKPAQDLQTQEQAFVLLASQALLKTSNPVKLARDGKDLGKLPPAPSFTLTADDLRKGVSWRNDSGGQLYRTLTIVGAPTAPPPPIADEISVEKSIYTRTGAPVSLGEVRQNDRLVVVLRGKTDYDRWRQLVVADLLPAGFEIETVLKPRDGQQEDADGPYAWIGRITQTQIAEARDDRFVSAFNIGHDSFTLAYVVRAVTPGAFTMPGVVVEDMYRPQARARTISSRVTVTAAK